MLEIFSKVTVTDFRILKVHTKTMKAFVILTAKLDVVSNLPFLHSNGHRILSSYGSHGSLVLKQVHQGLALTREKLAGSLDGVGNIFSEKF